ncbi:enoyl-CoA hydratase/isomerase family protein [Acinetobacter sp. ANC 4648]|uniref:enoyl-CoA hydratase/isomerase family protein n=1 Tax=Acinetobacter sp. ANC 4648 TaxID=1977875 RepID=UPI000A32F44A|nr:enoyl-CoA hydratase/isomerase family protein [Acinetobacter sp. ANC 4648]OTG85157.1 enoyl-CoA hydratase [Acinetobacter sp. ANC 4648]
MSSKTNLISSKQGTLGILTLDRATHLNALSLEMIQGITTQLEQWRHDNGIQAILINSNSPKAFCAGGDIRYLYECYQNSSTDYQEYFASEYTMLTAIRKFPKPIIVFLDGYVLGGGFGLAQACHIVVSSEKSRFAMPETAIGFFPDVAATHFLSRLDDIGVYMALTGEQISSSDALSLDLIDYHVPSEHLVVLQEALVANENLNKAVIEQIVFGFITHPVESELRQRADSIHRHFAYESLAEIEQSLASETDPTTQPWAHHLLNILQQRSLVAKQTSLKLQWIGRSLSLEQCMQLERDLQDIWFEHGDFIEGVRALIIDKDKRPQWQPHSPILTEILENLTATA